MARPRIRGIHQHERIGCVEPLRRRTQAIDSRHAAPERQAQQPAGRQRQHGHDDLVRLDDLDRDRQRQRAAEHRDRRRDGEQPHERPAVDAAQKRRQRDHRQSARQERQDRRQPRKQLAQHDLGIREGRGRHLRQDAPRAVLAERPGGRRRGHQEHHRELDTRQRVEERSPGPRQRLQRIRPGPQRLPRHLGFDVVPPGDPQPGQHRQDEEDPAGVHLAPPREDQRLINEHRTRPDLTRRRPAPPTSITMTRRPLVRPTPAILSQSQTFVRAGRRMIAGGGDGRGSRSGEPRPRGSGVATPLRGFFVCGLTRNMGNLPNEAKVNVKRFCDQTES
jgi:hypothetical protein